MVELRWVVRGRDEAFRMAGVQDSSGFDRILQYRVLVEVAPSTTLSTHAQVTQVNPSTKQWTPWMDVPFDVSAR